MRARERKRLLPGPDLPGEDVHTSAMVSDHFEGAICRADPHMWDLSPDDGGNAVRAVIACYACPVLARCAQYLETIEPAPEGVVWAGMILDHPPSRTPRWHRAFRMTVSRYANASTQ
jgi:hypothetical protein